MRRALLVFLTLPLALVLFAISPGVSAQALACTSTISVECQPANLPILIEAGVVSVGGGTTVATTVGGGALATTGAAVNTGAATARGVTGLWGLAKDGVSLVAGALSLGGLIDQVIKTDPDFVAPELISSAEVCNPLNATNCARIATSGDYAGVATLSCMQWNGALVGFKVVWSVAGVKPVDPGSAVGLCPRNDERYPDMAGGANQGAYGLFGWYSDGWGTVAQLCYDTTCVPLVETGGAQIDGQARTTIDCKTSAGGVYQVIVSVAASVASGGLIDAPDALCNPGDIATGGDVAWADPFGDWEVVSTLEPEMPLEQFQEDYPNCFGPTALPCELQLYHVGPGTELQSCGRTGELCVGWPQTVAPRTWYKCMYGQYELDLDYCSAYRDPTVGPLPNVDDQGNLLPFTAPTPNPLPNPQTDPDTGAPTVPEDPTDPASPGPKDCFPTGWGVLNPVEWVYKPVRCALEWAFVPRTSVVNAKLAELDEAWSDTMPYKLIATVTVWEFIPPPSGCNGITVDVWFLGPPFQIMQACPGDMLEPLAYWSRIFGNISFAVYGVIAITRHVARIFAFSGLGSDS